MPGRADDGPAARSVGGGRVRWSDLRLRVLSAVVLAPVVLGCLWLGGAAWLGLLGLGALGLGVEWARLCGVPARRWPGGGIPATLVLAAVVTAFSAGGSVLVLLAGALAFAAAGRRVAAAGTLYLGLALLAMAVLREDAASGFANMLFVMLVVWSSDIGAYLFGRLLGGPRLAPSISPGKTWSGGAGGLVAAILMGGVVAAVVGASGAGLARAALIAAVLGIASQAGDLLESAVKRRAGVKDSGWIIPGHGGLLDRLDGLLAAAPLAALLALQLGRGVFLWQ